VVWSQAMWVGGQDAPQAVHYRDIGSFVAIHPDTFRQRAKAVREQRDLRRANLRIYNSASMRDAVHARHPDSATRHHVVIHNGLDLTPFAAIRPQSPDRSRGLVGHRVLLPQSDAPHKRNWLAADILARLHEDDALGVPVELTIAGRGNYFDLRARLRDHGLDSVANFVGYVPRERMATLYASHDGVLMTGQAESFGNPIVEAHAAGRPVVTPPFPVALELGGPLTLVASKDDAPSLAHALKRALTMTMTSAALQHARSFSTSFSSNVAAERIATALDAITGVAEPRR
jgi:glycosyltransferase involved in cell wall biosynthesis